MGPYMNTAIIISEVTISKTMSRNMTKAYRISLKMTEDDTIYQDPDFDGMIDSLRYGM
jgi:hypothetical protein